MCLFQGVEPCSCAEGEEDALVGDTLLIVLASRSIVRYGETVAIAIELWWGLYILHDHIVGGDAIARNEEEGLVVNLVEVADLASGNEGESTLQVNGSQSLRHGELC